MGDLEPGEETIEYLSGNPPFSSNPGLVPPEAKAVRLPPKSPMNGAANGSTSGALGLYA